MKPLLWIAPLLVVGCTNPPAAPPDPGPKLNLGDGRPVMPLDHPPVAPALVSGGTARLSVKQLKNSLPVVLGGPSWQIGAFNGFDIRAVALGEPDYISVVDENLEPSPLYLKFMGDMARSGCNQAMTNGSIAKFVGPSDTVATNKAAVDTNLRYLRLAFHGIKVAPTDDQPIADLRKLFDDTVKAAAGTGAVTQAHVTEGWRTVCVALLTAPEYHLY